MAGMGRYSVNVIWLVGWLLSECLNLAPPLGHQSTRNEVEFAQGPWKGCIMIGSYVLEESLAVSNPPRNSMCDFFCGDPDKWLSAILEHCSHWGRIISSFRVPFWATLLLDSSDCGIGLWDYVAKAHVCFADSLLHRPGILLGGGKSSRTTVSKALGRTWQAAIHLLPSSHYEKGPAIPQHSAWIFHNEVLIGRGFF